MSANTVSMHPPTEVLGGMSVEAMAGVAHHAGRLATKLFDVDIPKGVDPSQVVRDAAAAVPMLWAIKRGEPVDPSIMQSHIDKAAALKSKMHGSTLPGFILGPITFALGEAAGAKPAETPDRIREALRSQKAQASLAKIDPYLRVAEQFDVGPQLSAELAAIATRVRDVARVSSVGKKISPDILAQSIYAAVNDIISGRAPMPMIRAFLSTSGSTVALPPFSVAEKKLAAAAPAIMEAVDAALPPSQRDEAFLDSMRTSTLAKAGAVTLNGGLRAIKHDVEPLLTNLIAMMPKQTTETRRQLHQLFSAS